MERSQPREEPPDLVRLALLVACREEPLAKLIADRDEQKRNRHSPEPCPEEWPQKKLTRREIDHHRQPERQHPKSDKLRYRATHRASLLNSTQADS